MNNLDINNPNLSSQENTVAVKNNRLVVDTHPSDYGTFAVTTLPWTDNNFPADRVYQAIPFYKASSFRLNNYTGKTIGIRKRHKKVIVDDFEDSDSSSWTGSVEHTRTEIEGFVSGTISTMAYRSLTTEEMTDGAEVEVKFRTPPTSTQITTQVKIFDNANRIGIGEPAAQVSFNPDQSSESKVILRLRPSTGKYDAFVESPDRVVVTEDADGEYGQLNMVDSIIAIESTHEMVVDSIIYQQKMEYSVEQIVSPSSVIYPCEYNTSEYEIINLGSDLLNYSDTNIPVSLSGFYAV